VSKPSSTEDRTKVYRNTPSPMVVRFPISFRGKLFAGEKLLSLYDQADGSLLASLAWERFVPTSRYVHLHGCRLAFRINKKKMDKGTFKEKNRHIYCGAYQLKSKAIRDLPAANELDEVLSADLVHRVEDGELAHTDLRIVLKPREGLGVEGTKTAILVHLWNVCSGPLRHKCECDRNADPHPSSKLEVPPSGEYRDTRSLLNRIWSFVRFQIANLVANLTGTREAD
jgi:hypothetical protein